MKNIFSKYRFYVVAILLFLTATLLLFCANCSKANRNMEVLPVKAIEALPDFQVQDIAEIELQHGKFAVKLARQDDFWLLSSADKPSVIAAPAKVLALLEDLSKAKLLRELTIQTEAEAADLSLADDAAENKQQTLVILRDKNGKEVRNLKLGKIHYSVGEQIGKYRANIPDGRYVKIQTDEPHYFLISRPIQDAIPLTAYWANPIVCPNMGTPVIIRYLDLANNKILWEVRLTDNGYKLTTPAGKRLDVKKMQEKFAFLNQAPLSRDIASNTMQNDFKPDSRLYITYANGFSYTLDMQNDPFDEWKRFGCLTPAYDPEFTFRQQEESDAVFEKRKQQYQEELKREQKLFGGKVFILRPNLINIFETVPEK